uniref:Uncharacterized protein n=1 Tax=Panagrolaimus sp. ES5 TaxID=591445 RepID=A0AC34FXC0_9BILA
MPNLGEGMAMLIYLSPNPAFYKNDEMLEYKNIPSDGLKLYQKLRNISISPNDDTSKWQIWSFNSSTAFNFTTFFYQLLNENQYANFTDFKFVITNPEYIQSLEKVLIETSSLEMQALFLNALKESVKNYNCDNIFEDFIPHLSNILYLSLNNDTVIQEARFKLIADFQKLTAIIESLIQPYLHNQEQQKLVEEKLKNVELTTDVPNWLQLDDSIERLNSEYHQLSTDPSLFELQKFAFQEKLSKYQSIHEALRSFEHDSIPMSSNKIYYSEMGNWLTVPIAPFMQYNYGRGDRLILEFAINIAKIVSFNSFRWSSTGTERNFENQILPLNLKEQNFCFKIHKIAKEDYSILMGLEAAWQMLTDRLTGIEKREITKKLANFVAEKNTTSSIRIAAGFLERHHENLCKNENILPCFV